MPTHNSWFNVQVFGVKGDGSTDDTAAIQSAMDAARDAGGGVVYVPASKASYRISGTLTIYPNLTIQGDGRLVSVIGSNNAAAHLIHGTDVRQVGIRDIRLTGASSKPGADVHGVFLNKTGDVATADVELTRVQIDTVCGDGFRGRP
jgi:hypothetical protein